MTPSRVGYYVHHQGSGHRNRAAGLTRALTARGHQVTGLSSAERPAAWPRDDAAWIQLDRDDQPVPGPLADVTARGRLHWVPAGHQGLLRRAAQVSMWLDRARPALFVSDVSQEMALLARLHGVRVLSVLLPGWRHDPAHALGLGISDAVVAFWPSEAAGMTAGLPDDVSTRVRALGGLSRFAPAPARASGSGRRLVVLGGTGGGVDRLVGAAEAACRALPGWTCHVLGGASWTADPFSQLRSADVVLTHAGQNAVAEVAAARVPAVVVAQERPFQEQRTTAEVLDGGRWPAVVADGAVPHPDAWWAEQIRRAAALDGSGWRSWVDGAAASRFVDVVESLLADEGALR